MCFCFSSWNLLWTSKRFKQTQFWSQKPNWLRETTTWSLLTDLIFTVWRALNPAVCTLLIRCFSSSGLPNCSLCLRSEAGAPPWALSGPHAERRHSWSTSFTGSRVFLAGRRPKTFEGWFYSAASNSFCFCPSVAKVPTTVITTHVGQHDASSPAFWHGHRT